MALIRLGSLVTRISGKVGGQTFGTSSSGSYIRNTGTPRKAITNLQRSKMSLMATTSQAWRALTQNERNTFIAASPEYTYLNRVGETKNYSGFAIFAMLRNNVANTFSELNSPPVPIPLPKVTFYPLVGASVIEDSGTFKFTASGPSAGLEYRLFITLPGSLGVSNQYTNFFFINKTVATASPNLEIPFSTQMVDKWGAIPSNSKLFWRLDVVDVATGQILKGLHQGEFSWGTL